MAEQVDTPTRTFTAGAALAQFLRVKLSAGKLAAAGLGEVELGTITTAAFADGDVRAVALNTKQGTVKMVADGAITLVAAVYGAAGGKVSATANGHLIGTALVAASGNNSVLEVLRNAELAIASATTIADPTGGTPDAEARTAINAILVVLENAGLTLSA